MQDTARKIHALHASLAAAENLVRCPLGHGPADACLKGGLPSAALHEVFAESGHEAAATGFTAGLCARVAADKSLLWIRQDFSALEFGELAATGFLEMGIDPGRVFLLRLSQAADVLRAGADALRCAGLGAVVLEIPGMPKVLDLVASRRLTLLCAKTSVTAFLLRFQARPDASAAETRWSVRAQQSAAADENWGRPVFDAALTRNRHGAMGHWDMEWNGDDGFFTEPAADSGAVVSAPFHRPAQAAVAGAEDIRQSA